MSSTSAGWLRVAAGLQKVVQAATSQSLKETHHVTESMTKHGVDIVGNARTAVTALSSSASIHVVNHIPQSQQEVEVSYEKGNSSKGGVNANISLYAQMKDADGISIYERAISNQHQEQQSNFVNETTKS